MTMMGDEAYALAKKESKKYTDKKLGNYKRIEVLEEDPFDPEEEVLYLIMQKYTDIPVKDYYFRFDAMELGLNNNDKVAVWEDMSEYGNDLTQPTSAEQPTYLSNGLNGKPTVQFANSSLFRSPFTLDHTSGASAFVVMQVDDGSSSSTILSIMETDGSNQAYSFRISGSAQAVGAFINTWSNQPTSVYADDLSGLLYSASYDRFAEENKMYQDGIYINSMTGYGNILMSHNTLRLGMASRSTMLEPYTGRISEVVYFSRVLTAQEIDQVNTYLLQKWGV